jgi:nucleoside-diphosphate-sugar epimerase
VTDTVAGFLKAGYAEDVVGSVINLGTGKDVSIAALTHLAAEALGRDVKIISKSERKRPESSEVEQLCADASRARAVLGWEPVVSLRDGLRTTAHWIQANLDLYNPEQYDI